MHRVVYTIMILSDQHNRNWFEHHVPWSSTNNGFIGAEVVFPTSMSQQLPHYMHDFISAYTCICMYCLFNSVVRLFDCRQQDQSCLRWKIKGEVERVLWDSFSPFNFFVCSFEVILDTVSNSLWIQRESMFTCNVNIYNKVNKLVVLSCIKHWMYMNIFWMDSPPLLYDANRIADNLCKCSFLRI